MSDQTMNWIQNLAMEHQITTVMELNTYTAKFQLSLSRDEIKELMIGRKEELKNLERVEFGEGVLPKIIYTFCDSSFIYQDNYQESLFRLQEIFYLYKNESMDECSDDELLDYMKESFEGECQGSLEYLEDTALEHFAREIRKNTRQFFGRTEENHE